MLNCFGKNICIFKKFKIKVDIFLQFLGKMPTLSDQERMNLFEERSGNNSN